LIFRIEFKTVALINILRAAVFELGGTEGDKDRLQRGKFEHQRQKLLAVFCGYEFYYI